MDLKPGDKIKLFYNEGNLNNRVMHIRAIIDDQVVYRISTKDGWVYRIQHMVDFDFMNKKGHLLLR